VRPHTHFAQIVEEGFGRARGIVRREVRHMHPVDAECIKACHTFGERADRPAASERHFWQRIEGLDKRGHPLCARPAQHGADYRLMTEMDAIEGADGNGCARRARIWGAAC
jgi:hypothetical protein